MWRIDHLKRYCSIHFSHKYFDFGHWWATQCPTRMFVETPPAGSLNGACPNWSQVLTSYFYYLHLVHILLFFLLDALHYVVNCCHGKRRTTVESDTLAKGDWHLWELTLTL